MTTKGLLIGIEGVLCSTSHLHRQAWEYVCAENGIDYFSQMDTDIASISREEQLHRILTTAGLELSDGEKQVLLDEKNSYYRQLLSNVDKSSLMPGIEQLLVELQKQGIRICVVSGSKNTVLILRNLGILNFIDAVLDGNDGESSFESIYPSACHLLGLPMQDCCVWENIIAKQQKAKSEGMRLITGNVLNYLIAQRGQILNSSNFGGER